jgi:hypothetical protein
MSEQAIQTISVNVGALGGTVNRAMFRVPSSDSAFGGITITKAYILAGAAATSVLQLVNLGTALGTAVSAVIGTLNATLVANVQQALSITTPYQASGTWIGLKTLAGGGLDTVSLITIEFKWGK